MYSDVPADVCVGPLRREVSIQHEQVILRTPDGIRDLHYDRPPHASMETWGVGVGMDALLMPSMKIQLLKEDLQ